MAHIRSIATSLPDHVVAQHEVVTILTDALGHAPPARLADILLNTGIERRHIAMAPERYFTPRQWGERADVYLDTGMALAEGATREALAAANIPTSAVGTILFVSTTGTATPSIPSRMIARMGFDPGTVTLPLFGWGCAGGGLGLAQAAMQAEATGAPVLLICLELCSLAYDHQRMDKKDMVALALFADGCAAALVAPGAGQGTATIGPFARKCWPDTIDMMGWQVGDSGFDLVLARDIPQFVARDFAPFADAFLAVHGVDPAKLGPAACHPGGGRVVDALALYFGNDLAATREVLRTCGNMSSPTVLSVIARVMADGASDPYVVTALGPGFTGVIGLIGDPGRWS